MSIDAACKRLMSWTGYAWDGLYPGRLREDYQPRHWTFDGAGNKIFQGRQDDVRDIVRELVVLALQPDEPEARLTVVNRIGDIHVSHSAAGSREFIEDMRRWLWGSPACD